MFKTASILTAVALASKCSDLHELRSAEILKHFDESKLEGHWFENAVHDVAQSGASCQVMENTLVTKGFKQEFSTYYSLVPFS